MFTQKEFYFIRHGQTNHHHGLDLEIKDISLNLAGIKQAHRVEQELIHKLPITHVYTSPLKRAQETANILLRNLSIKNKTINELKECNWEQWQAMTIEKKSINSSILQPFFDHVMVGLKKSLSYEGIPLIIAHGGVHWLFANY